jgi:hypothetical protein
MSAVAALAVATVLAGCGSTTYTAGRTLPPSGMSNRVLITVQNPSTSKTGAITFVDAYYDIRSNSSGSVSSYSISGYSGSLPTTIQNMPEEQIGAVYGSGDGSLYLINYAKEASSGTAGTLDGLSTSVFITHKQTYVFAANQAAEVLTVIDKSGSASKTYTLSLPGVYRVSVNPGASVAMAFVQNSNYVYYARKLTSAETTNYSQGSSYWTAKGAVDCEPQNDPAWCVYKVRDSSGNALTFDRPVKAIFSADGATAYVLNCGPECGGTTSSITHLPVAPMIYLAGESSGSFPTQTTLDGYTLAIPGGASNALRDSTTMYIAGQEKMSDGYWGGHLTVVDLSSWAISHAAVSISDGSPGAASKMIEADDDTLWIGMQKCTSGERYNNPSTYSSNYGCLTMYNTSSNTVTMLEPYEGDATGIAAVTGLNKVYAVQGGQVYIFKTASGDEKDNQYVTVTGTAYDVAYMDADTDDNNTTY